MNYLLKSVFVYINLFLTSYFIYGGLNEDARTYAKQKNTDGLFTNAYINLLQEIKQVANNRLEDISSDVEHNNSIFQFLISEIKKIPFKITIHKRKQNHFLYRTIQISFLEPYNVQKLTSLSNDLIRIEYHQKASQATLLGDSFHINPNLPIDIDNPIEINGVKLRINHLTLTEIAELITNSNLNIRAKIFSFKNKYGIKVKHNEYGSDKFIEIVDCFRIFYSHCISKAQGIDAVAQIIIDNRIKILFDKGYGNILCDENGNIIELNPKIDFENSFILDRLPGDYWNTLNRLAQHNDIESLGSGIITDFNLYNIDILTKQNAIIALEVIQKAIRDASKIVTHYEINDF